MTFKLKTLLITVLTLAFLAGCSSVEDATILAARDAVKQGAVIIDVRTPKEYKQGHVATAQNIPIEVITKTLAPIPKGKEIVVYCASGNRSGTVANILRQNGWTVYDVATQKDFEREITLPVEPQAK